MTRTRILVGLAALATVSLLVFGALGAAFGSAFLGNAPMQDGQRLADGSVQLVVDGFVAAYVVEAPAGLVLVDAGNDPEGAAILAALAARGAGPEDVSAVLITHGHPDHLGAIGKLPKAEVLALADEVPLLTGEEAARSPVGRWMGASDTGVRATRTVRDGERLQVAGAEVQVFAIPGHTDGSAAWLLNGVLFLGDSAGADTEGVVKPATWVFSNSLEVNDASLRGLAERLTPRGSEVKALAFGHTAPLEGFQPLARYRE